MKNAIYLIALLFSLSGCEKEGDLTPSKEDRDWFVLTDDSDAPVDKAIYKVYEKWGIPVFYNDTIGQEERGVDKNGEPIVYYRVLDLNYSLNATGDPFVKKRFSRVTSEEEVMAGVRFVDEVLLPKVPDMFHLTSILLTDTLGNFNYGSWQGDLLDVYKGLETLALGKIPAIVKMDAGGQQQAANKIVSYLIVNYLGTKEFENMKKFYKVSYDPAKEWEWYKMQVMPTPYYPGYKCLISDYWENFGFLDYEHNDRGQVVVTGPVSEWWYKCPTKEADIEDFVIAVLDYTPEEFEEKYAKFPKVLEKFRLLREVLVEQKIIK